MALGNVAIGLHPVGIDTATTQYIYDVFINGDVSNVITTGGPTIRFTGVYETSNQNLYGNPVGLFTRVLIGNTNFVNPNGRPFYFDSGWVPADINNNEFNLSVNLVETGVPTDTGSGSANPELHLKATILVSWSTNPAATGLYVQGQSPQFDVQWGVPTLSWSPAPSTQVEDAEVTALWSFVGGRNTPQKSWDVQLTDNGGNVVLADSGLQSGTTNSYVVPYLLEQGQSYALVVQASNTNGVPATPLTALFVSAAELVNAQITGGPLSRFIQMVAFQLDIDRSNLEQLRNVLSPTACPGNLLPYLAASLGVPYESALGMSRMRKLLGNVVHEYKNKGTIPGIEGICSDITGWASQVAAGPNQMPAPNWYMEEGLQTFPSLVEVINSYYSTSPPVTVGSYSGVPATWPNTVPAGTSVSATVFGQTSSSTETGTITFSSLAGTNNYQSGIIVQDWTTISASIWSWSQGLGSANLRIQIIFYSANGTQLGDVTGSSVSLSASGSWQSMTLTNQAVPAGSVYAELYLTTSTSFSWPNTGFLMLAAPMVVSGASLPSTFSPARQIQVTLFPDRENLVLNPSFESDSTTHWSASGATLTAFPGVSYLPVGGTAEWSAYSGQMVSTGAAAMSASTVVTGIDPTQLYTASIYVYAASIPRTAILTLAFYNAADALVAAFTSTPTPDAVGSWNRLVAQVTPLETLPSSATSALITVTWSGVPTGEIHYLDAALLETGWSIKPYFDGLIYGPNPDYFYANNATFTGPSYYYHNLSAKESRLYRVLTGQPGAATPNQAASNSSDQSPFSTSGFVPAGASVALVIPPA